MTPPLIIAHRTVPPYAPENSLEGMRVAFEQGADAVEIDLQMSLDQRPFLLHDKLMRRTTGWLLPPELTPSPLIKRLRLRGGVEGVPSLAQALDALPGDKAIAVDVKTPWAVIPLLSEVQRRGIAGRTLVWAASALCAGYAVRHNPGWEVAYYKDYADGPSNRAFIEKARRLGAQAVSLDWRAIDGDLIAFAHQAGLRVYSWHKDYELTPEKLRSGLDGLITDHPARARQALATLPAR
jgi:glycerophosphoryl diester phosphodiesterase